MIIAHKYGLKVYPNGSQTWLQVHWEKDNIKKAHFTGNVKCAQASIEGSCFTVCLSRLINNSLFSGRSNALNTEGEVG